MAGIGISLSKFLFRGKLTTIVCTLGSASLVSCGPWLMTIICLSSLTWITGKEIDLSIIRVFGIIVIYNFCFSLVLFGPLILVIGRYLGDKLYAGSTNVIPGLFLTTLLLSYSASLIASVPFYFLVTDFEPAIAAGAVIGFALIGTIWTTTIFLHAVRNFGVPLFIFACGMGIAFLSGSLLAEHFAAAGMVWGFNVGLFFIAYGSIGVVLGQYGNTVVKPFGLWSYFRKYWDLVLCGIFYYTAIWIDKWIMWGAESASEVARFMFFNAMYEYPMFLAYVSIIPGITVFFYHLNTQFFTKYYDYYRGIEKHAPYSLIRGRHKELQSCVSVVLANAIAVQAICSLILIMLSPLIIERGGGAFDQIGIFRVGILGTFMHAIFLYFTIILFHFDMRKSVMVIQLVFLICNASFTYITVEMGVPYYGYGYFFAAAVACVGAFGACSRMLNRLPFITFVSSNPSVR